MIAICSEVRQVFEATTELINHQGSCCTTYTLRQRQGVVSKSVTQHILQTGLMLERAVGIYRAVKTPSWYFLDIYDKEFE